MLKIVSKLFQTPLPSGKNSSDHLGWPTRSDRVSQFHEISENLENPWFSSIFNIFINLVTPSGLDDFVPATKTWEMLKILFKHFETPRKRTFPSGKNSPDHLGWSTRVGRVIEFRKFPKIMKKHDF